MAVVTPFHSRYNIHNTGPHHADHPPPVSSKPKENETISSESEKKKKKLIVFVSFILNRDSSFIEDQNGAHNYTRVDANLEINKSHKTGYRKQVVEQEIRFRNSIAALISFSLVAYFPQAKRGDFLAICDLKSPL